MGFENHVEYSELPLHISVVFLGPFAGDEIRELNSDHSAWSTYLEHCFRKGTERQLSNNQSNAFPLIPIPDAIVSTENAVFANSHLSTLQDSCNKNSCHIIAFHVNNDLILIPYISGTF